MKKRSIIHDLVFYGIIFVLIAVALTTLFTKSREQEALTYDKITAYINNEQV